MNSTFAPFRLKVMNKAHMAQVMAIQSACYTAIEPESLAAMEAKRVASQGLAHVAAYPSTGPHITDAGASTAAPEAESAAQVLGAYIIAMPIRWPELPALNSEPMPDTQPDTLYVHDLAIHPRARACGLGAQLLQAVQRRADALGLRQSALVAIQGSVPFWLRHGYVCVATPAALAQKIGSYGDAQLMVKNMPQQPRVLLEN